MGDGAGPGAGRRGAARRAGAPRRGRPSGGARRLTPLLIREVPATELTIATRILVHLGALPAGGRVALRVGNDVVYLAGRGVPPEIMTPYDVAAVRFGDGLALAGEPPEDADRYLAALRGDPSASAAASAPDGSVVAGVALAGVVERLTGLSWSAALESARAVGGLVGAYPAEASG